MPCGSACGRRRKRLYDGPRRLDGRSSSPLAVDGTGCVQIKNDSRRPAGRDSTATPRRRLAGARSEPSATSPRTCKGPRPGEGDRSLPPISGATTDGPEARGRKTCSTQALYRPLQPAGGFDGMRRRLTISCGSASPRSSSLTLGRFRRGGATGAMTGACCSAPDALRPAPKSEATLIDEAHEGASLVLTSVKSFRAERGNYLGRTPPGFLHRAPADGRGGRQSTTRNPVAARARLRVHNGSIGCREYRSKVRLEAVTRSTTTTADRTSRAARRNRPRAGRPPGARSISSSRTTTTRRAISVKYCARARMAGRATIRAMDDDFQPTAACRRDRRAAATCRLRWRRRSCAWPGRWPRLHLIRGEVSRHRDGARRGATTVFLPAHRFVNFLQNHDADRQPRLTARAVGPLAGRAARCVR